MRRSKYNKGKKPPAFISNLYRLLEDQFNSSYVKWRQDKQSFIIFNVSKFAQHVLPKYYKHANYSSFVRQLNMYNFVKLRGQFDREHVYSNQLFTQNNQQNLRNIKRRQCKNSNILSLAQALNSQIQIQSNSKEIQDFENNSQNQIISCAAPANPQFNFFGDFPGFDELKLTHSLSDYLIQTQKFTNIIPPVIPLKYVQQNEQISFPLKSKIDEMKDGQNQLQQVCIGLFKQNQFLTSQNKRLQQKLRMQFKKKQQILNQIIKYVINFLSQWNGNSDLVQNQKQFRQQRVISDEQSSSDIVLESYNMFQKSNPSMLGKGKFSKKNKEKKRSSNKGYTFSKYAQNQKKILLTLLQQIQKSYSQKFFFTGSNLGGSNSQYHPYSPNSTNSKQFKVGSSSSQFYFPSSSSSDPNSSANSFLMSMLLKFIESNNLVQVINRFSLLINLQRNKKTKNFTVVNCMKDLTEHFGLNNESSRQELSGKQFEQKSNRSRYNLMNKQFDEQFDNVIEKERFLENEKQTINEMEKQLALITNKNNNQLSRKIKENNDSNCSLNKQNREFLFGGELEDQCPQDYIFKLVSDKNKLQNCHQKLKPLSPSKKIKKANNTKMNDSDELDSGNERYLVEKFDFSIQ